MSINPLYTTNGSCTQGELEGAKPASNKIKCRAKPCIARRAWSEATIFVPQGGTKITTLLQAVEKAKGFFDSLRAARDIRAALCAVTVKNPLSAFFVENCGECSGVKRELAIYPNTL